MLHSVLKFFEISYVEGVITRSGSSPIPYWGVIREKRLYETFVDF